MNPPVAVNFDASAGWPPGKQVTQRIEYVVNQVAQTHRGQPEADIVQELQKRLRGMGVPAAARQLVSFAHTIASLPPLPPPPRSPPPGG